MKLLIYIICKEKLMASSSSIKNSCDLSCSALLADNSRWLPPELVIKILSQLELADLCRAISNADLFGNVFKANWSIFTENFQIDAAYGFDPTAADVIRSFCVAAEGHWEY